MTSRISPAFALLLVFNILSALYSPIHDCDEVFNFWEPAHYLTHGYGLQTWEYSPEYALRSWAYIVPHSLVLRLASLLPLTSKSSEFYILRLVLGLVCAVCELRLFSVLRKTVGVRVSMLFVLVVVTSPGLFHASSAFLPSSFTMCTTMLGIASFMDAPSRKSIVRGIVWFALGAIYGWPFSALLIVPFAVDTAIIAGVTGQTYNLLAQGFIGSSCSLILLVRKPSPLTQRAGCLLTVHSS